MGWKIKNSFNKTITMKKHVKILILLLLLLLIEIMKYIQKQYRTPQKRITEFHAVVASRDAAAGNVPRSPGLDSATDGNQIQECTDLHWKQKNGQSPSWTPAIEEKRPDPHDPSALN